jgi:hypothetical protein
MLVRFTQPLDHTHIDCAIAYQRADRLHEALAELDAALAIRDSAQARAARAQVLLSLGRYAEGFAEFQVRWQMYAHLITPADRAVLESWPRWRGEDPRGKRIVLVHEQGLGDTIMMLRYVPQLQVMGADVVLVLPPPLQLLAAQLAPVVEHVARADYALPMFDLPMLFGTSPASVPPPPYLRDEPLVTRDDLTPQRIGIAWSSASIKMPNDVGRDIDLGLLRQWLMRDGIELVSLQAHDRDAAQQHDIIAPRYDDFGELAAVISVCDTIVCIDTAALHLAGALGHPKIFALLPFVCSWRWRNGNPWYPSITLCRQTAPDHWPSALAQVKP